MRRLLALACALAACSSPSVDPGAYAKELPPAPELDATARQQADALGDAALSAAVAGALDAARRDADAALAIDPRQARARAALGVCGMHDAQAQTPPELLAWRRAEGDLRQAAELAPGDAEILLALARFYAADGHGRAASDVLTPLLAQQPQHVAALRLAGLLAYEASEERRARGFLARLHALVPDDAQALYRLAICEATVAERLPDAGARVQAWQHVVELFQRYRVLAGGDPQGVLGEAQARVRLWQLGGEKADEGELAAVRALYRAAQRLDSSSVDAVYGEGYASEESGDLPAAESAYRRALALQPTHVPSLLNLAALLASRGDRAAARELWQTALGAGLTPTERRKVAALAADD
ncbi:MAG: tetratricopeptide repeat protein [Planctomycetota bacterium]